MINYKQEYEPEAIAALAKLAQSVCDRILKKINWLACNLDQITPQPLTGNLVGLYKLRVGDYRVLYSFSSEERIITIHLIGHRREIYN